MMINKELLDPKSIVVVGASNDITKPGGKIIKNLLDGGYKGVLKAINPKEKIVQGIKCYSSVAEVDNTDLAIFAIAAKLIPEAMEYLVKYKNTKAFIVLSAGFSETGKEGKELEKKLVDLVRENNATMIGPNCIGVINTNYAGVFAGPIPKLDPMGCDFVTGSGATAVFILETAIEMGLKFSSIYSVGNSAWIGVEDILKFWDETYVEGKSPKVKLIYIEQINKPEMFLNHSRSLVKKGCKIVAIKAGTTEAGSRAVSSHTGALAGSDTAVDALFSKAGIIRCYGRTDMVYTAAILTNEIPKGKNIAVVTHAGGPGVMLTDVLNKNGISTPLIEGDSANELKNKLHPGSSVANPIDFLATGTPEQLGIILDFVENKFDNIDASVVIFGTPGLYDVKDAYKVLDKKIKTAKKPIYSVLPSVVQASEAIEYFKSLGNICFFDEVLAGLALAKVLNSNKPFDDRDLPELDTKGIRKIMENSVYGFLSPQTANELLKVAGIPIAKESVVHNLDDALVEAEKLGYPLVMKVVGPVHKTDIGGVVTNIKGADEVEINFNKLIKLPKVRAILLQPMYSGTEIFIGAKYEKNFGHIVLTGLGGIFIEIMKDFSVALSPVSIEEGLFMIRKLKAYDIVKGIRGQEPIDENRWAELINRLSALLQIAPEIIELDLNPLIAKGKDIVAVDARIKVKKL